ncbi:MAG: sulfur carrier protein ThiS [Desulfotignum sp.]|nr:sulfur carrier protein ThiS [Desulfobacteraceae bacterium]
MIQVDDNPVTWHKGMTIADLLEQMEDTGFCSVVRLNGKLVSSPGFHETPIPDGSVIRLLPLVAGG